MIIHNKIFKAIMKLSTINSIVQIQYRFYGTDTVPIVFCS